MRYLPIILRLIFLCFGLITCAECIAAETEATDKARAAINAALLKGKWSVSIDKDRLTLARQITMKLWADEARVGNSPSRTTDYAGIVAKCIKGRVNLYFVFPDKLVANDHVSASYRIGSATPKKSTWAASENHEAFGPWDGPESKVMLRQALSSDDLYIESSTRIFSSTNATFDLKGLREALGENIKECGV